MSDLAIVVPTDLERPFLALVQQRLDESDVLPELRQVLRHMAEKDASRLAQGRHWSWVIPSLQRLLGGPDIDVTPFLAAWSVLHLATSRLDHLQDGDPDDELLLPTSAGYNLALSAYALATSLLNTFSSASISPHRLLRLHRLWSSQLLRTASGQQRDLMQSAGTTQPASLAMYQEIAQAKSGAMFALAFGGTATLLTDDDMVIGRYCAIGELFGTLVQYCDDALDQTMQQAVAATLPTALRAAAEAAHVAEGADNVQAFWNYLYAQHLAYLADLTACASPTEQAGLRALFAYAFEQPSHQSCP